MHAKVIFGMPLSTNGSMFYVAIYSYTYTYTLNYVQVVILYKIT